MYSAMAKSDIRQFKNELKLRGRVLFNEPLAAFTSIGVGGPAQVLVFPQDVDDLVRTTEFAARCNIPLFVVGCGSNLLVKDEGVSGIVVCLKEGFNSIARKGDYLVVQTGAKLSMVIRFAVEEELGGLETLIGIPGTMGGAVVMNAGTREGNIAQVLEELKLLGAGFQLKILKKDQLKFGYRQSYLPEGSIILEVKLKLTHRPKKEIKDKMSELLAKRFETQPVGQKSAGCIFKNPPGGFAGKLIEEVGLKGYCLGDAQVSNQHANFIVNKGQAAARNVLELIELIKQRVWEERGVKLEEEVIIIGQQ